ncbi:LacI family DNA-binding transcriptional regulator [Pleomorphomonas koreensis]|uniref:substrate-binding domain-containing protein n=1 Tax=Pleomorphomonas koreensis TaxID=257440 RepID=UPI00041BF5F0|nr:LacI family DNA-binding transcriptional regulator [Pleomorphomonas koreensis]
MKVGVRDIAREAGVAVSTVSHVLNGTASISREVRDRVLAVARDLGYLDQRRAKATIATMEQVLVVFGRGFVAAGEAGFRHRVVYEGLRRECERRSLKIVPVIPEDEEIDVGMIVGTARAEKADGVIVIGGGGVLDLGDLVDSGLSLVVMNGEERLRRADAVVPANAFAAGVAVRHLKDAGHRRVAMLSAAGCDHLAGRRAGFAATVIETGLSAAETIVAAEDGTDAGAAALARRLAAPGGLDGATALFCLTDPLAEGALRALAAAGLDVPADISVIGCDGLGEVRPTTLATVNVGYGQLGGPALAIIESRLTVPKPVRACLHVECGTELIAGATVGPPPDARSGRDGGGAAGMRRRRYRHGSIGMGGPHARLVPDRFH